MRKASTRLPEQGTQTPSPAPDLIPAEPKNQPKTHIAIGTANGGTSHRLSRYDAAAVVLKRSVFDEEASSTKTRISAKMRAGLSLFN
jgi:hypothetical protein